jgi:hypothetical protein
VYEYKNKKSGGYKDGKKRWIWWNGHDAREYEQSDEAGTEDAEADGRDHQSTRRKRI